MTAILNVKVVTDPSNAIAGLDKVEKRAGGMASTMRGLAAPALAAGGALAVLGNQAADQAKLLQESSGAVESVFKSQADVVKQFAQSAADNVGLATSEYQQMAAVIGSQLKNAGTPMEELAGQTDNLIALGADLAATYGGTTSDAVAALSSLMRGETDPIERYGVSIKQADIEAKKAELGLNGLTGEAARNADAQARLALLSQQTADAQGAFAREAGNAGTAQQKAAANWQNAAATLGTALLPLITRAATLAANLAGVIERNSQAFTIAAVVVGALATAIIGANLVITAMPAIMAVVTAAQWAWNLAMSANPIGLIIAGIVLLIAGIVLLVRNHEGVRKVALAVWNAIKAAATAVASWIAAKATAIGQAVSKGFSAALNAAGAALTAIRNAATGAWNAIRSGITALVSAVTSRATAMGTGIIRGFQSALNGARAALNAIRNAATGAWNTVVASASRLVSGIGGAARSAANAALSALRSIPSGLAGIMSQAVSSATSALNGLVSAVAGIVSRILGQLTGIPGRIRSAFAGLQPPSWLSTVVNFLGSAGPPEEFTPTWVAEPQPLQFSTASQLMRAGSRQASAIAPTDERPIQIIIQGALDPTAVAAQVRNIINADARRRGVVAQNGLVLA